MTRKAGCSEIVTYKVIVFSENRSKLSLINTDLRPVEKVIVDGCQITTGIRCDHFALKDDHEYYIELKGSDIPHAFAQIEASIKQMSADIKRGNKTGFIICTRSPLASAEIQILSKRLKQTYNISILVRSVDFKYNI